jgi:hypothetical protein
VDSNDAPATPKECLGFTSASASARKATPRRVRQSKWEPPAEWSNDYTNEAGWKDASADEDEAQTGSSKRCTVDKAELLRRRMKYNSASTKKPRKAWRPDREWIQPEQAAAEQSPPGAARTSNNDCEIKEASDGVIKDSRSDGFTSNSDCGINVSDCGESSMSLDCTPDETQVGEVHTKLSRQSARSVHWAAELEEVMPLGEDDSSDWSESPHEYFDESDDQRGHVEHGEETERLKHVEHSEETAPLNQPPVSIACSSSGGGKGRGGKGRGGGSIGLSSLSAQQQLPMVSQAQISDEVSCLLNGSFSIVMENNDERNRIQSEGVLC